MLRINKIRMKNVYIEYAEEIFRFLRRMLGNKGDAEDVLTETFLILLNMKKVNKKGLKQLLYRIAYTKGIDFLRKKRRNLEVYEKFKYSRRKEDCDPLEIEEALLNLNEKERVAILLFFEDGYKYDEIGDIMRIPIGTVKTLIHRGKEKLKSYFKGDFGDEQV